MARKLSPVVASRHAPAALRASSCGLHYRKAADRKEKQQKRQVHAIAHEDDLRRRRALDREPLGRDIEHQQSQLRQENQSNAAIGAAFDGRDDGGHQRAQPRPGEGKRAQGVGAKHRWSRRKRRPAPLRDGGRQVNALVWKFSDTSWRFRLSAADAVKAGAAVSGGRQVGREPA